MTARRKPDKCLVLNCGGVPITTGGDTNFDGELCARHMDAHLRIGDLPDGTGVDSLNIDQLETHLWAAAHVAVSHILKAGATEKEVGAVIRAIVDSSRELGRREERARARGEHA